MFAVMVGLVSRPDGSYVVTLPMIVGSVRVPSGLNVPTAPL
jgi:hypothetical protein